MAIWQCYVWVIRDSFELAKSNMTTNTLNLITKLTRARANSSSHLALQDQIKISSAHHAHDNV